MKKVLYFLAGAAPLFAGAQSYDFSSLQGALTSIASLLNSLVPIIIGLAVIVFLWGVLMYVISKDDDAKEKGRQFVIYGIAAIFVMVSVWGLVNVLRSTLRLDNNIRELPQVPIPGNRF